MKKRFLFLIGRGKLVLSVVFAALICAAGVYLFFLKPPGLSAGELAAQAGIKLSSSRQYAVVFAIGDSWSWGRLPVWISGPDSEQAMASLEAAFGDLFLRSSKPDLGQNHDVIGISAGYRQWKNRQVMEAQQALAESPLDFRFRTKRENGDNEEPYLLVVYLSDEDPDARTIQKQLEENYSFVRVYFTDSWD